MFNFLMTCLSIFVIYIMIGITWALAEKFLYGKIMPKGIDSAVAFILAVSLYFNFI